MTAKIESPNEDARRAADILQTLEGMGIQNVTMDQALAVARSEKRNLVEGIQSSANGTGNEAQIAQLRAQIERLQKQTVKKEGFLTSVAKFPLRHPFLTTTAVLAGLVWGTPGLLRYFGATESSFGKVAMDWFNRMGSTIGSLSSGTGRGALPTIGGLGGPALPGTM